MPCSDSILMMFSDLIRKELEIDSASIYAALPRKEAVKEIHNLLTALGTAPPKQPEKKKMRILTKEML